MSDNERLDRVEHALRTLFAEVRELRALVEGVRGGRASGTAPGEPPFAPASVAPPHPQRTAPGSVGQARPHAEAGQPRSQAPAVPPVPRPRPPQMDLESLVGRYGALALAVVAIILGVGVFLSWAAEHVRLDARTRVALGALTAVLVAGGGLWLRKRGSERFGNVLLGLSLGIVHVVAWGAGPYLEVVPPAVAFAVAAAASIALAALAWREREEPLFVTGLAGALLAPFVTSSGEGNVHILLGFGLLVIGAGLAALRDRPWMLSKLLLQAGGLLYVGSALYAIDRDEMLQRIEPAAMALTCAWCAFAFVRPTLAVQTDRNGPRDVPQPGLWFLVLSVLALIGAELDTAYTGLEMAVASAAVLLTGYAVLTWRGGEAGMFPRAFLALGIPLATAGTAQFGVPFSAHYPGAALLAGWAAAAGAMAWSLRTDRSLHLSALTVIGVFALLRGMEVDEQWEAVAVSAWCTALVLLHSRTGGRAFAWTLAAVIGGTLATAGLLLQERDPYLYPPFFTPASASALAACMAALAFVFVPRRGPDAGDSQELAWLYLRRGAIPVAFFALFLWEVMELAGAYSREMSRFLLVAYFAVVGVAALYVGRRWTIAGARHSGLAIAILAGVQALWYAGALTLGLRIASYLIAGAFLLAVAYWYRAAGETAKTIM